MASYYPEIKRKASYQLTRKSQLNYIFADFGENNTASVIYRQIRKKRRFKFDLVHLRNNHAPF